MLTVFVIIAGALAFGFLDIALSQFDDRRGILTQKAIEAVRQLPEGDATIAAAVALGSQFEPLNAYGTSWCAGGAAKYRKRTVIDPSR